MDASHGLSARSINHCRQELRAGHRPVAPAGWHHALAASAGPGRRARPAQWRIAGGAAWPSIVAQKAHWWNPANAVADSGAVAFGISSWSCGLLPPNLGQRGAGPALGLPVAANRVQ